MAGHSQFKNIMYRKGAQDARRSKLFSKLAREIQVAARTGMADPEMNSRLRAAVAAARAANMPKDNIERAIKRGSINYLPEAASEEEMLEAAIEAGAGDCETTEDGHEINCDPDDLNEVRDALERQFGASQNAGLMWKPQTTMPVDESQAGSLIKLLETLEDNDDVQRVSANFDIPKDVLDQLDA